MKYGLILKLPFNITLAHKSIFKSELNARKHADRYQYRSFTVVPVLEIPSDAIRVPFKKGKGRKTNASNICVGQEPTTEKKSV